MLRCIFTDKLIVLKCENELKQHSKIYRIDKFGENILVTERKSFAAEIITQIRCSGEWLLHTPINVYLETFLFIFFSFLLWICGHEKLCCKFLAKLFALYAKYLCFLYELTQAFLNRKIKEEYFRCLKRLHFDLRTQHSVCSFSCRVGESGLSCAGFVCSCGLRGCMVN